MEQYIDLVKINNFSEQDAKELAEIILREEGQFVDMSNEYDVKGMRWTEQELLDYGFPSVEAAMNLDCFHRLKSGLIVSWKY